MINSNDLTTARRCSKLYNDNLKHKEILFLFQDKDSREFNYIEVKFKPENFQHLTGILLAARGEKKKSCTKFIVT